MENYGVVQYLPGRGCMSMYTISIFVIKRGWQENMAVDHQCFGGLLNLVVTGPQWPWSLVSVWIWVLFENQIRAFHMHKPKKGTWNVLHEGVLNPFTNVPTFRYYVKRLIDPIPTGGLTNNFYTSVSQKTLLKSA